MFIGIKGITTMGNKNVKIVAFGASSSHNSINRQFAVYAASLFDGAIISKPDLNDYEMPVFSVDRERHLNHPAEAHKFLNLMSEADLIIVSLAEHNGSYTTAFKNILDWCSRINAKIFAEKPMLLLSASPGARGAGFVMEAAKTRFPLHGANILANFSLPRFNDNFDETKGITDPQLRESFMAAIKTVKDALQESGKS